VSAAPQIRELTASDRHALAFIFGRLGPDSRYQRYLGVKHALAPAELERYTAIDHWHHDALIAFATRPRVPVAVARYVRTGDFDVAEVAVEVVDAHQRAGIGTALALELRERALRAGIARFVGTMWRGNRGALTLIRRLGPMRITSAYGESVEFTVALSGRSPSRRS
jgi:GNAT superfamily N-acetyltransferase